ncbi:hypothetical protein ACIRPN_19330 [Streptomyces sp. NPDC101230]|uniref:hypothetical protein n=1 Tax=unclassified Streptomyces TaxID=2593676 RepID=UPI00380422F2
MADGSEAAAGEQGASGEQLVFRVEVSGTHRRREDLAALHQWLEDAPILTEARDGGGLDLRLVDSRRQSPSMGGELVQDILLVVTAEVARSVIENVWRAVLAWHRNRRRLANSEELPRVTLDADDGDGDGDPTLRRDTATGPGAGDEPGSGEAERRPADEADGPDTDGPSTDGPHTTGRDADGPDTDGPHTTGRDADGRG